MSNFTKCLIVYAVLVTATLGYVYYEKTVNEAYAQDMFLKCYRMAVDIQTLVDAAKGE